MTREEAIRIATGLRSDFKCESDTMVDFCNTVIKALGQEPVLDKIRAEISKTWCTQPKNRYEEGLKDQALKDMKIIDKYKESEVDTNGI